MKLVIRRERYEQIIKHHAKENLLDVCRCINFIEDNTNARFSSDHITLGFAFDGLSTAPDVYMKNGAYDMYHRLPMKSSWDCYCAFDRNHLPIDFIYINRDADEINRFVLGAMLLHSAVTIEIDTRKYKC